MGFSGPMGALPDVFEGSVRWDKLDPAWLVPSSRTPIRTPNRGSRAPVSGTVGGRLLGPQTRISHVYSATTGYA